jgi:hypothetical protein
MLTLVATYFVVIYPTFIKDALNYRQMKHCLLDLKNADDHENALELLIAEGRFLGKSEIHLRELF